jgi:hypothetical protein
MVIIRKEVDDATTDDERAHGNILNLLCTNVTRGTDRESKTKSKMNVRRSLCRLNNSIGLCQISER